MIEIKPIKTKKQYRQYLYWVEKMSDKKIKPGAKERDMLRVVLILIKNYEDEHYAVPFPNSI
jgi:HTH-type transcriptional regulator / antitoxin HigA